MATGILFRPGQTDYYQVLVFLRLSYKEMRRPEDFVQEETELVVRMVALIVTSH